MKGENNTYPGIRISTVKICITLEKMAVEGSPQGPITNYLGL